MLKSRLFKNERIDETILEDMEKNFYRNASEKAKTNQDHIKIMEHLNCAAELLENKELYKEAEEVTKLIEVVAKKKKEKDKEDKKKGKKKKEGENPKSSEEAVENLKTKGWMFSANDGKNASLTVTEAGDSDGDYDELKKLWD